MSARSSHGRDNVRPRRTKLTAQAAAASMEATMPDERPRAHDRYEYHPLAEMFPLLRGAEFDDLVEDIRRHGLREPIILFEEKVIDGRNRERACIKADRKPEYREMTFGDHAAALAYVVSKNIKRRHLTPEQKRDLIEKLLKADPGQSDRQIAKTVKADNKTVAAVRKEAEAREEIPHVPKRTDSRGRSQPAHKRHAANHTTKRTKSTIDLGDQCIEAVRETIERTVNDLQRTDAPQATFRELFAALGKVIEDIKRKTLEDAERSAEKRKAIDVAAIGDGTDEERKAAPGAKSLMPFS
jgi:hypothetical protein